jgi:hypothetical protein
MIRGLILSLALASPAGAFELAWPIACALGQTCHIQHYLDHDTGPGAQDFTCGSLSYDGHDGTDIALPNRAAMEAGVNVLAAAPGTVLGTRDDIADFAPVIAGKECGNGVLVADGEGWQTQYCHMKQGSVVVRPGDILSTGSVLGQVGQSGAAEFPHLHLTVRHNGKPVDPFAPDQTACGTTATQGLWTAALPYQPGGIQAAGFATEVPTFTAIEAGLPATPIAANAPALVLWAEVYGARAGDSLTFAVTGPDGSTVLQDTAALTRTQDLLFRATGRKLHAALPSGTYLGNIRLLRQGTEVHRTTVQVSVP